MFKFRSLILATAAATIALGGATAVTTSSADAAGWKEKRQDRVIHRQERRGVLGWFDRRDRNHSWRGERRHKKHWKNKRHHRYSEPAPRYYQPMK